MHTYYCSMHVNESKQIENATRKERPLLKQTQQNQEWWTMDEKASLYPTHNLSLNAAFLSAPFWQVFF